MCAEVARGANREKQARHFGLPRSKTNPDECQAVLARRFAESAKSETYVTLVPRNEGPAMISVISFDRAPGPLAARSKRQSSRAAGASGRVGDSDVERWIWLCRWLLPWLSLSPWLRTLLWPWLWLASFSKKTKARPLLVIFALRYGCCRFRSWLRHVTLARRSTHPVLPVFGGPQERYNGACLRLTPTCYRTCPTAQTTSIGCSSWRAWSWMPKPPDLRC